MAVSFNSTRFKMNMPKLLPDELAYSYIARLASVNGASKNLTRFVYEFMGKEYAASASQLRYDTVPLDLNSYFTLSDGSSFAARTSMAPLMSIISKDKIDPSLIVRGYYRPKGKGRYDTFIFSELKFCPICNEFDRQAYGTSYIHRSHCIPFVSTCHLHKTPLESLAWALPNEHYDSLIPSNRKQCKVLPSADSYAMFTHDMFGFLGISTMNAVSMKRFLDYAINKKHFDMDPRIWPSQIEEECYCSNGTGTIQTLLNRAGSHDLGTTLLFLMKLFKSVDEMNQIYSEYQDDAISCRKTMNLATKVKDIAPDMTMLDMKSGADGTKLLYFEHSCGARFWRGYSEFVTRNHSCPTCLNEKFTKNGFRTMFDSEFGTEFELIDDYVDSSKTIRAGIRHSEIVIKDRPSNLISRLRWLQTNRREFRRILDTGVVRDLVSAKQEMNAFIEKTFDKDELFPVQSLPGHPDRHQILVGLEKAGKVHALGDRVYCRTKRKATDGDLIALKYIQSRKDHYGIYLGDAFLETIVPGFTRVGNQSCMTNQTHEVLHHKLTVTVGKTECHVYRYDRGTITEQNWKAINLVEFLRHEGLCSTVREDHYIPYLAKWASDNNVNIDEILAAADDSQSKKERAMIYELIKEVMRCQEDR